MSRVLGRGQNNRTTHKSRKAGARHVTGLAGRPLSLPRRSDKLRHAVRRRPPLRERLAARVKQETKRLEPPKNMSLAAVLAGGWSHLRAALLPNDPRDAERREQSGEPVVALVGAVDLILLLVVAILLAIGTVMVYSSSLAFAYSTQDSNTGYYLIRQAEWLGIGALGMYVAMRVDYRRWRILAGPGLVLSAIALLLVLRYGVDLNGSTRWLRLTSFVAVEPSEFAKMGLVLYAAHWFAGQRPELRQSLRGLLPFGLVVGALIGLVFKQPDLGTSTVMAAVLLMIYFVAGARLRHLALLAVVAAVGVKLYLRHVPGYQVSRFTAWLHPEASAQGAGYHYLQLRYALGSGNLTGVGLGNSQSKFTIFQPHTDSIFAILGEEWGVVGTLGVLLLFLILAWRGMRASMLAPDLFGRLLAVGVTGTLVGQAMLNMAVVAQVVPLTGIPLPFISYGGSSLSISMVAAGILLNVSKQAIDLGEERDTASTYLWWRNRRPSLPVAGRRGGALERATGSRAVAAVSARRSAGR